MLELAFVACLAADPQRCEDRALLFADMPMQACAVLGQTVLAKWAGEHPGWRVTGWTCRALTGEREA